MAQYFVYILRTSGNTLYTGQTIDINRRMEQHRKHKGGAKYLRMYSNFELVYYEKYLTLTEALSREHDIKKMSKLTKESLIKFGNDNY